MIEKEKYNKTMKILIEYRAETRVRERYKATNEKCNMVKKQKIHKPFKLKFMKTQEKNVTNPNRSRDSNCRREDLSSEGFTITYRVI
jgi:DNA polymerase I-like protein with 3'-5' exonuclease and polymerase domains